MTQALSKYGVGLSLPVGELLAFTAVAIGAGVLAAIIPARRASRLNVLEALQYEWRPVSGAAMRPPRTRFATAWWC
jgi:putative ABC transport system permease protein